MATAPQVFIVIVAAAQRSSNSAAALMALSLAGVNDSIVREKLAPMAATFTPARPNSSIARLVRSDSLPTRPTASATRRNASSGRMVFRSFSFSPRRASASACAFVGSSWPITSWNLRMPVVTSAMVAPACDAA